MSIRIIRLAFTFLFISAIASGRVSRAQESDPSEPLLARITEGLNSEALRFGTLVQTVGDYTFDRDQPGNGFSLSTARLRVRGRLDGGFNYDMQTDFTRSTVILDARMGIRFSSAFSVDAGMFKAPFSAEMLISSSSTDFINRSRIVGMLAPNRQIGVAATGSLVPGLLTVRAGAFNGNGRTLSGNDNNEFLYVGRVTLTHDFGSTRLEFGANAAVSEDDMPAFQGRRTLLGADLRISSDRVFVSSEVIIADFDPDVGPTTNPLGYQITAGMMIDPGRHQVLARYDVLDRDDAIGAQSYLVVGYNFWPTSAFELQLNYLTPIDGPDSLISQILVNFQVAF